MAKGVVLKIRISACQSLQVRVSILRSQTALEEGHTFIVRLDCYRAFHRGPGWTLLCYYTNLVDGGACDFHLCRSSSCVFGLVSLLLEVGYADWQARV